MSHAYKVDFTLRAATSSTYTEMLFGPWTETMEDADDTASVSHPEYDLTASVTDETVGLGTVATPLFLFIRNMDTDDSITFKLSGNANAHTLLGGDVCIFKASFSSLTLTNPNASAVKLAIFISGTA